MKISKLEYVKMQIVVTGSLSGYVGGYRADSVKKIVDETLKLNGITVSDEPEVKPMITENQWRNFFVDAGASAYSDDATKIINDGGMKTFKQWWGEQINLFEPETRELEVANTWANDGWNACAEEYEHELKNLQQALKLKDDKIEILESKIEEVRSDLVKATNECIMITNDRFTAGRMNEIRQRHKLDGVKA
jgi:hypothetical protein